MNYIFALQSNLLSKNNIDTIINLILQNLNINKKSISKCESIVTKKLTEYLNNIERYPESIEELHEAINFLNNKCYQDFATSLHQKYPEKKILRNQSGYLNQPIQPVLQPQLPSYQLPQAKQFVEQEPDIIIIDKEERDNLVRKYGMHNKGTIASATAATPTPTPAPTSTDFLSYLTNPLVLQMFSMMSGQVNKKNVVKNESLVIDEILDIHQVNKLLSGMTVKEDIGEKIETDTVSEDESEIVIDLDNLTPEVLPLLQNKIEDLIKLKTQYLAENNFKMVKEVDEEKTQILDAMLKYNKKTSREAIEAKEKKNIVKGIQMTRRKSADDGDKVEYLDFHFDPATDYNNLKNIVIHFKSDEKITNITLVDYYLPFNPNNVTRFNNKFIIYYNNRVTKIIIPPGKYEIEQIIDYIKSQATYLDFDINENGIITIKNSLSEKFELMIDRETIFSILGFDGKSDNFKDKISYIGCRPYNCKSNETVNFCLTGTAMDPFSLKFDEDVTINKVLKKSAGHAMKQMTLLFTDELGHYYDFVSIFKTCLKVTYL